MSNSEVFDKAKWHFGGDFPAGLEEYQAYVHTGFYVGWLILNDLVSDELVEENRAEVAKVKAGTMSPVAFYEQQMDGVFTCEDVNEIGYNFTKSYLDLDTGQYFTDYLGTLAEELTSMYEVQDNKKNFELISNVVSQRFREFRAKS